MTSVVRESNVYTDTWNLLFGKLSALTDPGGKSKWLYSAFPQAKLDKKTDYPLIVITPADISYSPLAFRSKKGPIRFAIDVYSTSAEQLDTLSDSISSTMQSNEDNFLASGIQVMRLISTTYDQFSRENLRVHGKGFVYEFDFGWFT